MIFFWCCFLPLLSETWGAPRSAQSASPWLLCLATWICFINYSRERAVSKQPFLSLNQGREETVPLFKETSPLLPPLSLNFHNCQRLFPPHLRLLRSCQVGSSSLPTWNSQFLSAHRNWAAQSIRGELYLFQMYQTRVAGKIHWVVRV